MPTIKQSDLYRLLKLPVDTDSSTAPIRQNFGPTELDRWALIEGEENCFISQTLQGSSKGKPKVIFSYPLVSEIPTSEIQIALMSALINFCDFYLWPGENVAIHTCKPIKSVHEFLDTKHTAVSASKQYVGKHLSAQGEKYIVLDLVEYNSLIPRAANIQVSDSIDLTCLLPGPDDVIDKLKKCVDTDTVKSIRMSTLLGNEIEYVLKLFPNLETIAIVRADQNWVTHNFRYFSNLHISLENFQGRMLFVPPVTLRSLEFKNSSKEIEVSYTRLPLEFDTKKTTPIARIEITKNNIGIIKSLHEFPLEVLVISSVELSELDLSHLEGLKILELKEVTTKGKIILPVNLEKLNLERASLKNIDFRKCQKLRVIRCLLASPEEVNLLPKNIKTLTIGTFERYKRIDITRFVEHVEELHLQNINIDFSLSKFKRLEVIHFYNCEINSLDFKENSRLREILLSNSWQINSVINLNSCPGLESLTLSEIESEKIIIDISRCTRLNTLNLKRIESHMILPYAITLLSTTLKSVNDRIRVAICHSQINLRNLRIEIAKYIGQITFSSLKKVDQINIDYQGISWLNVNQLPNLKKLSIYINGSRDLSKIINLDNDTSLRFLSYHSPIGGKISLGLNGCRQLNTIVSNVETTLIKAEALRNIRYSPPPPTYIPQNAIVNSVSLLSFSDNPINIDTDTEQSKTEYKASGNIKISIETRKGNLNADLYRFMSRDKIEYDSATKRVSFVSTDINSRLIKLDINIPSFDYNVLQLEKDAIIKEDQAGVMCEVDFLPLNKTYPLPAHQTIKADGLMAVYASPPNSIEMYWDEIGKRFYFKPLINAHIDIFYRHKLNMNYTMAPLVSLVPSTSSLLPDTLYSIIRDFVATNQELSFLLNTNLSLNEKLTKLVAYCEKFTAGKLTSKVNTNIESLLLIANEKKGSCRHRTMVFMLLSHFINIATAMNLNERHCFPEIPSQGEWVPINLGGSTINDVTPADLRHNFLSALPLPVIENNKTVNINTTLTEKYNNTFKSLVDRKEFQLGTALKTKYILSPLIKTTLNQIRRVKAEIIAYLQNQQVPYIYIHSAKDLFKYFKAKMLSNGQLVKIDGPLKEIITKGGVFVVNWGNFSAREQAVYKSIIDYVPTIFGEPIAKNVTVIGLTLTNKEACTAFLSRCEPYTFVLKTQHAEIKNENSEIQTVDVDLFESQNWRKYLFGDIQFSGNAIKLEKTNFITGLKNKLIRIYNRPKDEEFTYLMQQLEDEHRIFYNGHWIEGITSRVEFHTKPYVLELSNVRVIKQQEEKLAYDKLIHIGTHNWHELFDKLIVNTENCQAENHEGYLASYDNHNAFYITQIIPAMDWGKLLAEIQKNYSARSFQFVLAPNAGIEGVMFNDINIHYSSSNIILTNDPEFWIKQNTKADDNVLIIDVNARTGFQDIIAKLRIEPQLPNESKFQFLFEEKILLNALHAKPARPIIINGELSMDLYQQLLPLVINPSFFECNGKRYTPDNRITLVMPIVAKQHLPLLYYKEYVYSVTDYLQAFPKQQGLVSKIVQFYSLANQLPEKNNALSLLTNLKYKKIKQFLHKLDDNALHKHNPIKGIFHYHYSKESEEYAYLNVCAKLLFRPDDAKRLRGSKLFSLLRKHRIGSAQELLPHIYKVLNCFSGEDLNRFFLQNKPIITSELIEYLWQICQSEFKPEIGLKSHAIKRNNQLQYLLNDPHTPFILGTGMPGVGKTFTVSAIQVILKDKANFYFGEASLLAWLTDPSSLKKILLLDEMNLSPNGTWDFLRGLSRDKKNIIYKGVEYPLTSEHKIVATGNPATFPGRYYHDVILENFELIHFKMPDADTLKKILEPILQDRSIYTDSLFRIYNLIKNFNLTGNYSIRHLQNLAYRFLLDIYHFQDVSEVLIRAAINEFAHGILDTGKREQFIEELQDMFNYTLERDDNKIIAIKSPKRLLVIPIEKENIVTAVKQDIVLREIAIHRKHAYTMGILLEGEAGLGKSTLYKALLEESGFTADNINSQRKYYEVSVGDEKSKAILLQAFDEGAVVILDELNLDISIEELLNQLLEGRGQGGQPASNPGFMVFASQNPSFELDREPVSQALRDRMHVLYIDEYSQDGLIALASTYNIEDPASFVALYQYYRRQSPDEVNMRTFFTVLNVLAGERLLQGSEGISRQRLFGDQMTSDNPSLANNATAKPAPKQ